MKLLIVEDETRMADLLRKGLTEEGHTAVCAFDGGSTCRVGEPLTAAPVPPVWLDVAATDPFP